MSGDTVIGNDVRIETLSFVLVSIESFSLLTLGVKNILIMIYEAIFFF